jgi:hypothetical protein
VPDKYDPQNNTWKANQDTPPRRPRTGVDAAAGSPKLQSEQPEAEQSATASHQRRSPQILQKPPRDLDVVSIMVQVFIAIIGTIAVLIYAAEWYQMYTGGTQTERIISAANINAGAATSFAISAINAGEVIGSAEQDFAKMAGNSGKAIQDTQDSMRLDERAWVGFSVFSVGRDPSIPVMNVPVATITNTGRSPARKVVAIVGAIFHKGAYVPGATYGAWIEKMIAGIKTESITEKQMIFRSDEAPMGSNLKRPREWGGYIFDSSLLPPNYANDPHLSVTAPMKVSIGALPPQTPVRFQIPTNWRFMEETTVIIYGRLDYRDVFGKLRFSNFCSYRIGETEATFSACPVYNDMQ